MTITLYNSRTRKKEFFKPLKDNVVGMYVCGPTVYDFAHIGNARPVIVFDVLYRLLKQSFKGVTYIRNVTDIDDKIIKASKEKNISIKELTERTLQAFHEDMDALYALRPTHEPKATQHIEQMLSLIERLLAKKMAYICDKHVLFDVSKYEQYGLLSKKDQKDLLSGVRIEKADYKKNNADFILWKPAIDGDPGWKSPWGYGRPGWHLECSAMSYHFLGKTFDIHGGGIDLIFPHHENEVAQSCCGYDADLMANFWLHNGHLTVNGEKMSKSLKNFITVRDLLKDFHPEVVRLAILSSHYRQPLDFNDELLENCKNNLNKFYRALEGFEDVTPILDERLHKAIKDDLNTPQFLSVMHEHVAELNKTEDKKFAAYIKGAGEILGLLNSTHKAWFQQEKKDQKLTNAQIENYILQRNQARTNKNFSESDRIRDLLKNNGILLEDTSSGTKWSIQ